MNSTTDHNEEPPPKRPSTQNNQSTTNGATNPPRKSITHNEILNRIYQCLEQSVPRKTPSPPGPMRKYVIHPDYNSRAYKEVLPGQNPYIDPIVVEVPKYSRKSQQEIRVEEKAKERKRLKREAEKKERLEKNEKEMLIKREIREKKALERETRNKAIKSQKDARKAFREQRAQERARYAKIRESKRQRREHNSEENLKMFRIKKERQALKKFKKDRNEVYYRKMLNLEERKTKAQHLKMIRSPFKRYRFRDQNRITSSKNSTSSESSRYKNTPRRRNRSLSEPRDMGRAHLLLPKTAVTAAPPPAPYIEELNKTVESIQFEPLEVVKFAKRASKSANKPTRSWMGIRDPYHDVRQKRYNWLYHERFLFEATPDEELYLSSSDDIRIVKDEWEENYQKSLKSQEDQSTEPFQEITCLAEKFGFLSLRDFPLVIIPRVTNKEQKTQSALIYLVEKFQLLIAIWKCQNQGSKTPRVIEYFLFYLKKELGSLDNLKLNEYQMMVTKLLFWLPIHLGDLRSEVSLPREHLIGLSRQMSRTILNDFPLLFDQICQENANSLFRLEVANLRLETTEGPMKEWLGYWRPAERVGVFGNVEQAEFPENPVNKSKFARKVRARSHSFSEFTEDVPVLDRVVNLAIASALEAMDQ